MNVWIVSSGDYEQHDVDFVASDLETAIQHLKNTYQSPYVVMWEEPEMRDVDWYTVRAHFSAVQHYSTEHMTEFDIRAFPLISE